MPGGLCCTGFGRFCSVTPCSGRWLANDGAQVNRSDEAQTTPTSRRCAGELRQWFQHHPLVSGDVVLLHDAKPLAAQVIPDIAAALRKNNLTARVLEGWDRGRTATASPVEVPVPVGVAVG